MRAVFRIGVLAHRAASWTEYRGIWLLATVAALSAFILTPAAEPGSFLPGVGSVSAASDPNPYASPRRASGSLNSVGAVAVKGTPASGGPSANVGQTITLKGPALGDGVANFPGYAGTPVTSTLTSVKPGKKGKAVVPNLAITGGVSVKLNNEEAPSNTVTLQIVPTINTISASTVAAGDSVSIDGTGFAPDLKVRFPGVAALVTPSQFDQDSAAATVPTGIQKGKLSVITAGGTSNTVKVKVAAASTGGNGSDDDGDDDGHHGDDDGHHGDDGDDDGHHGGDDDKTPAAGTVILRVAGIVDANRILATDVATGHILATDDLENTLSVIDPTTSSVLRTIALPGEPVGMQMFPDARRAIVAVEDERGRVSVVFVGLDAGSVGKQTILGNAVGDTLSPAQVDGVVVDGLRGTLSLLGTQPSWTMPVGPGLEAVAVNREGTHAAVVAGDHGVVYVVDLAARTVVATVDYHAPLEGVAIGVDGRGYTMDRASGHLLSFPIH